MKRFSGTLILAAGCYLMGTMVINPAACVWAANKALALCAEAVVPSLFPFFVCSNLLIALGGASILSRYLSRLMRPLFGIPGSGALAVVLGVVSGYPVGADCVAALYTSGSCTKAEAERMLTFCNNSGPLFVMGAVGVGMLHNPKLGAVLYGVHILSALLTGLLFRRFGKGQDTTESLPPKARTESPCSAVGGAVANGVSSILKVCGFVVVFAVLTAGVPAWRGSQFLYALLEITGGIQALLQVHELGRYLLPAVSFFLAFSGVSVLLQVAGIIMPAGLSVKPYLMGKLTQGVLAFLLTGPALGLFDAVSPVFLQTPVSVPAITPKAMLLFSVLTFLWCGLFLALLTLAVWLSETKKGRFRPGNFWHTNRRRSEKHENQETLAGNHSLCLPDPDRVHRSR